jgi:exonuclease VII large subunit
MTFDGMVRIATPTLSIEAPDVATLEAALHATRAAQLTRERQAISELENRVGVLQDNLRTQTWRRMALEDRLRKLTRQHDELSWKYKKRIYQRMRREHAKLPGPRPDLQNTNPSR